MFCKGLAELRKSVLPLAMTTVIIGRGDRCRPLVDGRFRGDER